MLWLDTVEDQPDRGPGETFRNELAGWWAAHRESHHAFVAQSPDQAIVGMAWVALAPRTPRPGATSRFSGDIQTVYVEPRYRGGGVGSALVDAAASYATNAGAIRVTVHSGRKAVPVYERLGFASTRQLLQRPRE